MKPRGDPVPQLIVSGPVLSCPVLSCLALSTPTEHRCGRALRHSIFFLHTSRTKNAVAHRRLDRSPSDLGPRSSTWAWWSPDLCPVDTALGLPPPFSHDDRCGWVSRFPRWAILDIRRIGSRQRLNDPRDPSCELLYVHDGPCILDCETKLIR